MAPSRSRDVTAVVPRRLVAGLIDLGLTVGLSQVVGSAIGGFGQVLLLLLYMVSHYVLLPGLRGVTLGKLIMRLRVVNGEGNPPGIIPAIVRTVAFLVDAPLLIGFMLMTGSPGHRRLGDTAAGTFVVSAENAGKPLPVDRFRLSADAPKPTKIEDPAIVARRVALDKKKQKKKRKDADPYIIPWTPGTASDAATRAKEADLDAMAAAAGNANRQGGKKPAPAGPGAPGADSPMAHTAWRPSDPSDEEEPELTGRAAKRAAARADKQAKKEAKAAAKVGEQPSDKPDSPAAPWRAEQPAMAARTIQETPFDADGVAAGPAAVPAWTPGATLDAPNLADGLPTESFSEDAASAEETGKRRKLSLAGWRRKHTPTADAAQPWTPPPTDGAVYDTATPTVSPDAGLPDAASPGVAQPNAAAPGWDTATFQPTSPDTAAKRRLPRLGRKRTATAEGPASGVGTPWSSPAASGYLPDAAAASFPAPDGSQPSPPWAVGAAESAPTASGVPAPAWIPPTNPKGAVAATGAPITDETIAAGDGTLPEDTTAKRRRLRLPSRRPSKDGEAKARRVKIRLPRRKGSVDGGDHIELPPYAAAAMPGQPSFVGSPGSPSGIAVAGSPTTAASGQLSADRLGGLAVAEIAGDLGQADSVEWGAIDPNRASEPQWDAERGSYVQFDLESWRWMVYVHEEEVWRPLG